MLKTLLFLFFSIHLLYSEDNIFKTDVLTADSLNQEININDNWFAKDKGIHMAASFILTGFTTMCGNRFLDFKKNKSKTLGVSVAFSLALGKEIYDERQENNHFSYKDLTADLAGIILAVLVFN